MCVCGKAKGLERGKREKSRKKCVKQRKRECERNRKKYSVRDSEGERMGMILEKQRGLKKKERMRERKKEKERKKERRKHRKKERKKEKKN